MRNTILLVDDNQDLRELFQELIEDNGFVAVTFATVEAAKHYLSIPDNVDTLKTIVTDLMMLPSDGLDFLTYIKGRPDLSQIDLYLLTGASTDVFAGSLTRYRLSGIIEKPFRNSELIARVCGTQNVKLAS